MRFISMYFISHFDKNYHHHLLLLSTLPLSFGLILSSGIIIIIIIIIIMLFFSLSLCFIIDFDTHTPLKQQCPAKEKKTLQEPKRGRRKQRMRRRSKYWEKFNFLFPSPFFLYQKMRIIWQQSEKENSQGNGIKFPSSSWTILCSSTFCWFLVDVIFFYQKFDETNFDFIFLMLMVKNKKKIFF